MNNEKKQCWIIASSGSEWDDVYVERVIGTKQQAKEYLAAKIEDAVAVHKANDNIVENASTTVESIRDSVFGAPNRLYGFINLSDSHEDYTATPEMPPVML